VLLTGYFDESGTHRGSPVSVVAGYIATVIQWRVFESKWRKMLDKAGVETFHVADLCNSRNEFHGWTEERRRVLIKQAARIIKEQTELGVGFAVLVNDFYQVIPLGLQEWVGGLYGWTGMYLLGYVRRWAKEAKYPMPVNCFFEAGAKGRHELDRLMGAAANIADSFIGGWGFQKKNRIVQLQAADFLAYEIYKNVINRDPAICERPLYPVRMSYQLLVRKTDKIGLADADQLRVWVDQIEANGFMDRFRSAWFLADMNED
jgi:hypothetical protein